MKKDNQNQIRESENGEANVRPSFFGRPKQRHYVNVGAAIFAVIIIHLVAQFTFFKSESLEKEIGFVEVKDEQSVEIKPQYEAKKSDAVEKEYNVVEKLAAITPVVQRQVRIAPARTVIKKQEPRESRAERLRRAERILTGI